MAKPYRLSPLAEADLEDIWRYTFQHWSMEQADTYHHHLVTALPELANGTRQGRPAGVIADVQKYPCGSHMVYFLDAADHLDVIRILHSRQDPERHL